MAAREGWIRFGITLSLLWIAAAVLYVAYHLRADRAEFIESLWNSRNEGDWRIVGTEETYVVCTSSIPRVPIDSLSQIEVLASPQCEVKAKTAASLIFAPILCVWIAAFYAAKSFGWVRTGFTSK
jgi:hypothetical protein